MFRDDPKLSKTSKVCCFSACRTAPPMAQECHSPLQSLNDHANATVWTRTGSNLLPGYDYSWSPDSWIFSVLPSYIDQASNLTCCAWRSNVWVRAMKGTPRTLSLGITELTPGLYYIIRVYNEWVWVQQMRSADFNFIWTPLLLYVLLSGPGSVTFSRKSVTTKQVRTHIYIYM